MIGADSENIYIDKSAIGDFQSLGEMVEKLHQWCLNNDLENPKVELGTISIVFRNGKEYVQKTYKIKMAMEFKKTLDADEVV